MQLIWWHMCTCRHNSFGKIGFYESKLPFNDQYVTLAYMLQVARNLGKTLRAFQPTIRELQVGLRFTSCSVIKGSCMQYKPNPLHLGCIKGFQEHS
jgi:hypothetical protein